MTSHRACGSGCVSANLKLAGEQMLKSMIVHNQHDQVNSFHANLQAPASSSNGDKRGSAPTIRCAACRDTATVFAANHESTLHQVWDHDDTLRAAQHFFGDALIRSLDDGVEYVGRQLQTINRVLAARAGPENSIRQRKSAE